MYIQIQYLPSLDMLLKFSFNPKIGLDHLLMSLPAESLFTRASLGCLNKIITALPIPLCFKVSLKDMMSDNKLPQNIYHKIPSANMHFWVIFSVNLSQLM